MKKLILISGIIIVVLFVALSINNNLKQTPSALSNAAETNAIAPHYNEYSDATLAKARKNGNTVLFFAATTWCNTCSALDKELKERGNTLPSNVTVLKIDYDNDSTMKTRYAVTQQHTLVYLDRKGDEVKRWVGGNFNNLMQEIN